VADMKRETIKEFALRRLKAGVSIRVIYSEWYVHSGKRPTMNYLWQLEAEYHRTKGKEPEPA
jgi:hypothetical protein